MRGVVWDTPSLQGKQLSGLSATDLTRLGLTRQPVFASMTFSSLRALQRSSSRALSVIGAVDRTLGSLIHALSGDTSAAFDLSSDPDTAAARVLIPALARGVRQCAEAVGRLHTNVHLLQRDSALLASKIPRETQNSLRVLPRSSSSLFGSASDAILQSSAQRSRDDLVWETILSSARAPKRKSSFQSRRPASKMPRLARVDTPSRSAGSSRGRGRRSSTAKRSGSASKGRHPH